MLSCYLFIIALLDTLLQVASQALILNSNEYFGLFCNAHISTNTKTPSLSFL